MPADIVVDLSHHNGNVDLNAAAQSGIAAVIHKATQGTGYHDPMYAANKAKAQQAGLLWGAYHFGDGSDGVAQANAFLQFVQPDGATLLVLDFETNTQGPSMTLDQARAFVTQVNSVTGRWPGLYSGDYVKGMLGNASDPVLANCWFWLAQYGPTAVVPPNWNMWTLWQYTDGNVGHPPPVPGIGQCDRDRFNGAATDLQAFWKGAAAAAATAP